MRNAGKLTLCQLSQSCKVTAIVLAVGDIVPVVCTIVSIVLLKGSKPFILELARAVLLYSGVDNWKGWG